MEECHQTVYTSAKSTSLRMRMQGSFSMWFTFNGLCTVEVLSWFVESQYLAEKFIQWKQWHQQFLFQQESLEPIYANVKVFWTEKPQARLLLKHKCFDFESWVYMTSTVVLCLSCLWLHGSSQLLCDHLVSELVLTVIIELFFSKV